MNEFLRQILFLPEQASSIAREVDTLHYWVIGVTMVGWAALTLAGTWFVIRYRRRRGVWQKADYHPPLRVELTIIGGLLALFLVWWVIGFRLYVKLREPPAGTLDVYVVAQQWMWKFAQADGPSSVTVLTVPAGRPVRLLMTSRDVIHSFFVPAFRVKQDVLPGRYVNAWFQAKAGSYDILCAEYCGLLHSQMRGRVDVLEPEAYDRWLRETRSARPAEIARTSSTTGLAAEGRDAAARLGCLACHTLDGRPHIGPTWKGLYGSLRPLATGGSVLADEEYLTESMMDPRAKLVAGFTPVMPSYQGVLEPADAASIIELMKSLDIAAPQAVVPPWNGNVPEDVR